MIQKFLDSLWLEKGLSSNTLNAYGSDLKWLQSWLSSKDKKNVLVNSGVENLYVSLIFGNKCVIFIEMFEMNTAVHFKEHKICS